MLQIVNDGSSMKARIVVIGVGGAGNNAINRMVDDGFTGVEFIGVNTDMQVLSTCKADKLIQIGAKETNGLGAGGRPEVGEKSALENADELTAAIKDADMVFVTCGMGGGTGTGAAPVIAKIAKDNGCLTVAVMTIPFDFEANMRMENALVGVEKIKENVDTYVVVPNDNIFRVVKQLVFEDDAYREADKVLSEAVQGIVDIINMPGLINTDFADVKTTMKDKGVAHFGIGRATGEGKGLEAVRAAVENPLLDTKINSASHVLIHYTGMTYLSDIKEGNEFILGLTGRNVNFIYGSTKDTTMEDTCVVTVIATGLEEAAPHGSITMPNISVNKPLTAPSVADRQVSNPTAPRTTTVLPNQGAAPAGGYPEVQDRPRQVTPPSPIKSTVEQNPINVPEFLQRGKK